MLTPSSLTDAEIIGRVQGGEIGLYELLMRRYNQRLYRVIRSPTMWKPRMCCRMRGSAAASIWDNVRIDPVLRRGHENCILRSAERARKRRGWWRSKTKMEK
jgi:hypothetical protein